MQHNIIKQFNIYLFALAMVFAGCSSEPATPTAPAPSKATSIKIPKFDRDNAYALIQKQLDFGPRVPGTPAHKAARDWMISELEKSGAKVVPQDFKATHFDQSTFNGTNIIASYNPEHPKRILLAAHWDSRAFADNDDDPEKAKQSVPGADDGASGVAILMEVAKQLNAQPIDMGVDILLVDLEDQGDSKSNNPNSWCLGAQHWSRNPHINGYKAKFGVLLDMVGAKDARFTKEQISRNYAKQPLDKLWRMAQKMGYGNYFVDDETRGVTDDHVVINQIAKIPMLDIINRPGDTQSGFGHYWHTHKDDIGVIDKRTLKAVGQTILAMLYNESIGKF